MVRLFFSGARAGSAARLRWALLALVAFAAAWPEGQSRAGDDRQQCVDAYTEAQRQRKALRLRAALQRLVICGQPTCPAFIRSDCAGWHAEVDAALPSVIIDARDEQGRDVSDVRVSDGEQVLAERLRGSALPLDPGEHQLRFEHQGQVEVRAVLLREGEKRRRIEVRFGRPPSGPSASAPPSAAPPSTAPPSAAPPSTSALPPLTQARRGGFGRSPPTSSWVLGGVGLLALGGAAVLGVTQKQQLAHLRDGCAPGCERDDLDRVKRWMLVADVTAGAGALTVGVGLLLWALQPPGPGAARLGPGPGGGSLQVQF